MSVSVCHKSCLLFSSERSTWNAEDEVESAMRPPGGQESAERPLHNGLSDDSSSETSGYSESSSNNTSVRPSLLSAPPSELNTPPSELNSVTARSQKQWVSITF